MKRMRCDLHVHTIHSGMCTVPIARRFCRESFNDPVEAYQCLKRAGMDLITVTDHDSIGALDSLERFPDFFASEEVSVTMPSGGEAHMSVYGITVPHHLELQRRRDDLPRLLAYLQQEQLLFGINHLFSSLTGPRSRSDFDWFEHHFPVWEGQNGAMQECANEFSAALAARLGKPVAAGSDSHTLRTLARTYTEVPGARTVTEFLAGLRQGRGRVHGVSGDWTRVTADVLTITGHMLRERPWTLALLPFMLGIPVATFLNDLRERRFAAHWAERLLPDASARSAALPAAEAA
jgi:predicted metal-dependent phosphoesterase TrpH